MMTPDLTLNELLRLTLAKPVQWLSSNEGISLSVEWMTTIIAESKAGDLLIVPTSQIDRDLISEAESKGIRAILGLGKPPSKLGTIPENLALGCLPQYKGDPREVQRLLITMSINQRAALMERGTHIHARLSQLEAEGKGLEGLVSAMAEIAQHGVLVQDKRGQVLAHQSVPATQPDWQELITHLADLNSLPLDFLDRKRAGNKPAIVAQDLNLELTRLVAPIIVGEVSRGYLSIIGQQDELDSLDHLVIENGVLFCAIEMARNKAIREAEKRLKGDLLTAILQENLAPRDAGLWLQSMGLDLDESHIALRFAWEGPSSPSRRRLETIINGEISRQGLKAIVHPMGSEVICFCQDVLKLSRPDFAMNLGRATLDQAAQEYPSSQARCGIGTIAMALEDWRVSFKRAGQALDMARRLREDQPLYYADLSIYRLLFQIEHSPELIAFQEETLGSLLSIDGAQELIHTLEAFFQHNGNLSQTAEALFVHRNTLIYRLERIASITNLSLDKPENRLAIQLALHIHRMTAPMRSC